MTKYIFIILSFFVSTCSFAQKKIVFKKGLHREVIKAEKTIGLTKKGEGFKYEDWQSICSGCKDTVCHYNIWTLDSIHKNYIVVRQRINNDTAYKFDTISYYDKRKMRLYSKEWYWVTEIKSPDNNIMHNKLVYKYPIAFNRQTFSLDSLASFTFSHQESCNGFTLGLPLIGLIIVVGAPIASVDNGKFDPSVFIVGETVGLGIFYTIYRQIMNQKIRTYETDKWTIKVK